MPAQEFLDLLRVHLPAEHRIIIPTSGGRTDGRSHEPAPSEGPTRAVEATGPVLLLPRSTYSVASRRTCHDGIRTQIRGDQPAGPHTCRLWNSQLSTRTRQRRVLWAEHELSTAKSDPACAGFSTALSVRRAELPRAALGTSKLRRVPRHSLC